MPIPFLKNVLPWLLLVGAIGVAVKYIYDKGQADARADAAFADLKERQDSLDVLEAAITSDSLQRALADSARADSLARLEADRARLKNELASFTAAAAVADSVAGETGATLQDHLTFRQDTAGLRLLDLHLAADRDLAAAHSDQVFTLRSQLMNAELQAGIWEHRWLAADSTNKQLRTAYAKLIDINNDLRVQAEHWYRKSNPPFLKDLAGKALWASVGYGVCWAVGKAAKTEGCYP